MAARGSAAAFALALGIWGVGVAQVRFHDTPSGPHALPGDVLPPFGVADAPGGFVPPPHEAPAGMVLGPGRPPETTAMGPPLVLATRAAEAALRTCRVAGYRIGVAVIDSAGQARVLLNADGTDGSHGFVAMRKAETALAFAAPSSEVAERAVRDPAVLAKVKSDMLLDGGAVPLFAEGRLVGAIGASGAAGRIIGAQDEACAKAGARVVELAGRGGSR